LLTCFCYLPRAAAHTSLCLPAFLPNSLLAAALYFSIGSAFLPGHPAWCTVLLWAAAQIGALVAWQLRLPRVIGMLAAGMLLKNAMWEATTAFPAKWGVQMRAGALATIFLRCGLELDVGTMRRFKYPAMRLALLPGLVRPGCCCITPCLRSGRGKQGVEIARGEARGSGYQ
jgi:hypothetical protein